MRRKKYPHFHNGRFSNYVGEEHSRLFWRAIQAFSRMVFCRYSRLKEDMAPWIHDRYDIPTMGDAITWLGHSTFLIRHSGLSILTDPVFDTLSVIFKRIPPKITAGLFSSVDVVLLSHNHRDHMDEPALRILEKKFKPRFLVPLGDGAWFKKRGFTKVDEAMWWDSFLHGDMQLSFLPARHWSQRGIFDRNKSLWGSWMVQGAGQTIYFGGDTAYGDHFKNIAEHYPRIDYALMPIGPLAPDGLMRHSHINAEEAVTSFFDLGARTMIPMHWGTYRLGTDHPLESLERLLRHWEVHNPQDHRQLLPMKIGESRLLEPTLSAPAFSQNSPFLKNSI